MLKGFRKLKRLALYNLQYQSQYMSSNSGGNQESDENHEEEAKEPQPLKKIKLNSLLPSNQNNQNGHSFPQNQNNSKPRIAPPTPQPTPSIQKQQIIDTRKERQEQLFHKYPKIVGLINLGNTCYFNSALQNVLNTPILNEFFLTDQIKLSPNHKQVALTYQNLLKRMRLPGKNVPEAPSHLKGIISKVTRKFSGFRQEDSQEFLRSLLDCLHQDLNRVTKKPPYRELKADIHNLSQTSDEWFNYFKQREDSVVTDLFTGQLLNRVVCSVCQYESIAFDNFQDLSLSFYNNNQRVDLKELIKVFLQDEVLENSYTCLRCKRVRKCTRKFDIHRLPTILVIHLKRFLFGRFRKEKINQKVTFPIHLLNLKDFIRNSNDASVENCNYELYGIVNHYGDLNFGHYTAQGIIFNHILLSECKHPFNNKWYSYNDESVFPLNINGKEYEQNGSSSPYLLFYCKKQSN